MIGIEKALHILATQGRAALQSHAEQTSTAETAVRDILLAGRGLGLRDLRHELIFNLFRRISFEQAAHGLTVVLDELDRAQDIAHNADREEREARDDYSRNLVITSGYIDRMNKEMDRAEFLCGTGIDASAPPPSTTRAIDDLIDARARLSRAAEVMRAAEKRCLAARHQLAVLQHELSALVVATGPSTKLSF